MKNKIKNLRPIDLDLSLGYACPTCSTTHWVRLNQAQYDKFVIVCDCDTILKPKVVEDVKILYKKKKSPTNTKSESNQNQEIDPKILETCCKALFSYGFSKLEAQDLIKKAYATCKSLDCSTLIKLSLSNFGEKNG